MRIRSTRRLLRTTKKQIKSSSSYWNKNGNFKKRRTLLTKKYRNSSSRNRTQKTHFMWECDMKHASDFSKTKQPKCLIKMTYSSYGISSRIPFHFLKMGPSASTMTSSYMYPLCCLRNVGNSSPALLSWNLSVMSTVELKLCPSSITSCVKSISFKHGFRSLYMTAMAMATWRKKTWRTISSNSCRPSPSYRTYRRTSILFMWSLQSVNSSSFLMRNAPEKSWSKICSPRLF